MRNVDISGLKIDEGWTSVLKKQRLIALDGPYCFIGLDRASRFVEALRLGTRNVLNTPHFVLKVQKATANPRVAATGEPCVTIIFLHDNR